eukprot:5944330-Prymnesium_polylepis.1
MRGWRQRAIHNSDPAVLPDEHVPLVDESAGPRLKPPRAKGNLRHNGCPLGRAMLDDVVVPGAHPSVVHLALAVVPRLQD